MPVALPCCGERYVDTERGSGHFLLSAARGGPRIYGCPPGPAVRHHFRGTAAPPPRPIRPLSARTTPTRATDGWAPPQATRPPVVSMCVAAAVGTGDRIWLFPSERSDSGSTTTHEVQDHGDDREHDDDVNEGTQVYHEQPQGPEHQ